MLMKIVLTLSFVALDIVTGVVKALKNKCLSSQRLRKGLYTKSASVLILILGSLVDYTQNYMDLGFKVPLLTFFAIYIVGMEFCSIIENLHNIDKRIIPTKIYELLEKKEGK